MNQPKKQNRPTFRHYVCSKCDKGIQDFGLYQDRIFRDLKFHAICNNCLNKNFPNDYEEYRSPYQWERCTSYTFRQLTGFNSGTRLVTYNNVYTELRKYGTLHSIMDWNNRGIGYYEFLLACRTDKCYVLDTRAHIHSIVYGDIRDTANLKYNNKVRVKRIWEFVPLPDVYPLRYNEII